MMGDDASVNSFLALLEALPPRVALARGATQAARAAIRNRSTKLNGLHLIHTIAQDMARFEDKESKKSTTASMPSAKAGHGHRKRRSHRGSVHMLEPRQQHVVEEDIAELINQVVCSLR